MISPLSCLQLDVFKDQNTQLLKEFSALNNAYNTLQTEARDAEDAVQRLLGRPEAVAALASVGECEELERTLKGALEAVEERKVEHALHTEFVSLVSHVSPVHSRVAVVFRAR